MRGALTITALAERVMAQLPEKGSVAASYVVRMTGSHRYTALRGINHDPVFDCVSR
ncbi:MAG: hypothetical protein GH143_02080 [Calditrichaeota bacterium]|nr:hypothetical protein [Calditrichota bacterium]